MGAIGKALLGLGAALVVIGLLLLGLERLGVRSWRLPGDIATTGIRGMSRRASFKAGRSQPTYPAGI
jgi:hypothetical protein